MEFVETIFFLFLSSAPFDVAMPSEFGILMQGNLMLLLVEAFYVEHVQ